MDFSSNFRRADVGAWILSALLTVTGITSVQAQDAPTATLAQVRTTYVHPGKNSTFEEFLKRLNSLNEKHKTGMPTLVTRSRTGPNRYVSVTLMDEFADLKPGAGWVETFGAKEAGELERMISESVAGGNLQTFNVRRDLGRQPDIAPPDADAFVTILIKVKQDRGAAYEEALQKLVDASAKVAPDVRWIAYSPGMSSDRTYRVVVPIDWEDQAPGMPIPERYVKAFGEQEGARWMQQLSGATESVETFMVI